MIIATSYLPPIWYIKKLLSTDTIVIERCEHFVKQTIRNRCHILSPNGVQSLIVPVVHKNRFITPVKDIRIANDLSWQRQHWRSLCAAYRRSAYFEFYQDDMVSFYEKKFEFLFDFNLELLQFLLEQLQIKKTISFTSEFQEPKKNSHDNLCEQCNTGLPLVSGNALKYPQVFSYKEDFVSGLSIADLLFSMGPSSKNYIGNYTF